MNVGNYIAMAWAKNDNDKETSANFSFVVLPNQPIFHVNEVDRNYTKYVDSSIDLVVHVCYYEQININVYLFYDDIINMNEQQYIIIQKTYSKDSLYEDDINISVPITKNFDIGTNQIIFRVSAANDENKFSEDDISVQIYGSQPDMNFTIQKHHLYQYYNDKLIVSYNISGQIDESNVSIYYYIDNTNVSKPDNFKTLNHKSEIYSFIEEIPIPETIQFGTHKLIFSTCYEEFLCTTKEIEFIYSEYEYFPPNLDILEYNSRITRYKDSHLICRCKVYEKNEDSYVNVTATYQGDILNWTILNIDSESLELLDFEIPLSTKFNVGSNEIKICATNKYNMSNCSSIIVEAENPPPEIKVNPMRNYYYLQNEMNVFGYVLDYLAEENDENDVTIHASINNTEIGSTTAKITQTLMSYSYQIDLNINGYEQGFYQMKIIGINNLGKESNHIFHNFEFLAFSVKNVKQKSSSKIKMFLFGPLISK
ncbi:hypothetical protein TVAG_101860 [Trichomonas vaginalis G3]|uniref:Uncharacterized protein n=1 Tax=Trichomonas vaginalis (strain ATCC PRA-98 / G3) TaxID=412133 RepID=A2FSM0_TRIV3|nr:hypothetical protein TVAGG3_0696130 [Trichomonas vaginalis G3]EAX92097.1 hypothetical protein TVAG_101860 [Trichomonas vaginalis G3]KAI5508925.1 hypothetical protein TVAGG3_0696130 [Trichomonas vaginalis G3]|eukprot:XP_001305027.1 hypothetical protein [Trichomonas vaginalis G3]